MDWYLKVLKNYFNFRDRVVSLIIPRGEGDILTVTENGYGKRTDLDKLVIEMETNGTIDPEESIRRADARSCRSCAIRPA